MKKLFLLSLVGGTLQAAPLSEAAAIQDLRLSLEQLSREIHTQKIDMGLFEERALALESSFKTLKQDLKTAPFDKALEKRMLSLEKAQESVCADLKTLKNHIITTSTAVTECQTHIQQIDKHFSTDIQALKASMQTMLALLQGEGRSYTVQSGDSLGQIALNHKTDIQTLKKLNHLTSDKIYTGQKLMLP